MLEAEMLETNSPRAAQGKQRIQGWAASGRSQPAFCTNHGPKLATFGYRRKKFPQNATQTQKSDCACRGRQQS